MEINTELGFGAVLELSEIRSKSLAVQGALGELGEKACTELGWRYESLVNLGQVQFGLNDTGIYLLNLGYTDADGPYLSRVVFPETDLGDERRKTYRFVYLELDAPKDVEFTVQVNGVEGKKTTPVDGIQTLRIPIEKEVGEVSHSVSVQATGKYKLNKIFIRSVSKALRK